MKTIIKWIFTLLISGSSFLSNGQSDIVFLIDNSGSITGTEFNAMSNSINQIIQNVLMCNAQNRAAVVHYGTDLLVNGDPLNTTPKIYIESNFTSNIATAQNFQRRLDNGDFLHESTELLGIALDNFPNVDIVSPQTILTQNAGSSLVVFIFTDAARGTTPQTPGGGGSYLVNATNPAMNSNEAFHEFTDFKNNRGATFVVVSNPFDANAQNAAATIASGGGSYNGTIETYPTDPDNNQTPRYYFSTNTFQLSSTDIINISNDLCTIDGPNPCLVDNLNVNVFGNSLVWTDIADSYELEFYSDGECTNEAGTFLTANYIVTNTTFSIPQVQSVVGTKGFRFRIRTDCSRWSDWCCLVPLNASAYSLTGDCIPSNPCDNYEELIVLTEDILSGTTMQYLTYMNIEATNTVQNGATATYRASNSVKLLPGFHAENGSLFRAYIDTCDSPFSETIAYTYDADNGGTQNLASQGNIEKPLIQIYPNPTNGKLYINSESQMSYLELSSQIGRVFIKKKVLRNELTTSTINLNKLPTGVYYLKVFLDNGEVVIKQIIKK